MAKTKTVLMCPPTYFSIEYEINAWMHQEDAVDKAIAGKQWQNLHDIYAHQLGWDVQLITPTAGLPDMVFATDCCLMIDDKIMLSNFRYPERQPESAQYEKWFRDQGFSNLRHAKHKFEGGGDTLLFGNKIIAGYGFRSDREAHDELAKYFNREGISLRASDPFVDRLDTALAVLSDQTIGF